MGRYLTVGFWSQAFMSAFITLICLYVIKKVTKSVNIPVVSTVVEETL